MNHAFDDSTTSSDGHTAHTQASEYLCRYVVQHIIADGQVEQMVVLHDQYLEYMHQYFPDFYNPKYPNYPIQSIKAKLVLLFADELTFWQPKSRCKSELIFPVS